MHLRIWWRRDVQRFRNCVAVGAGANLRHTRALVFEDLKLPFEPESTQAGPFALPEDPLLGPENYDEWISEKEREADIISLLDLFPRNILHRFWYVQ